MSRGLSLGTRFVSVLPSRWLRRVHPLWICRLPVGGSRRRCQHIMLKRSWRNGERLLGSKKREGNDDLPNAQSDGVPRCTQERGIYASILGRSSTRCREQDEKSDKGGASCWAPCRGCTHLRNVSHSRVTRFALRFTSDPLMW